MNIGIYPAAFDPVHDGHLAFALAAQYQFKLDKVFFLPEPNPKHKQGVKALEHRVNMVHLAVANEPSFGVISLDLQEFDIRQVWPRITARFLGANLFMLVGSNPVTRLSAWPHTTEFGKQAPLFIIAERSGQSHLNSQIATLLETKKLDLPYALLNTHYETYSSNALRVAIKRGETPLGVPYSVMEYIQRNKLYISGAI